MKKILIISFILVFGITLYANFSSINYTTTNAGINFVSNKCLLAQSYMPNHKLSNTNGVGCWCDVTGGPDSFEGYGRSCEPQNGFSCNALKCTKNNSCCYSTGSPPNQE